MKETMKPIRHKHPLVTKYPHHAHNTEQSALKAGESSFKAGIRFYNNPYTENPCKSAWIRGFKRAEKAFFEGVKLSKSIQESLELEEVEA